MSILIDFGRDTEFSFERGLRGYVAAVARGVGVGLESCTLDAGTPAVAYIALDWRLSRFPDHDLALVWDETHGWAAAVEDADGATVLSYLRRRGAARAARGGPVPGGPARRRPGGRDARGTGVA